MTKKTALTIPIADDKLRELDATVREASLATIASYGNFEAALTMATGIEAIERLLTDEAMRPIMRLQNTAIGFRTDRDPAQGKNAYGVEVVRRCLIEAVLRGVRPVGNEFNIISDSCYLTKNGLARLVGEWPGLSDLVLTPSVPRLAGSSGALVDFAATWRIDGEPVSMIRKGDTAIAVRVNKGMGTDAIIGKATRKTLAAIYGRLTGTDNAVPEGEAFDTIEAQFDRDTASSGKVGESEIGDGKKASRKKADAAN